MSTYSPASRILSAGAVRVTRERTPLTTTDECGGQPLIKTREQGGVVREIVITCTCGKRVVIECDYSGMPVASS